MWIVAKRKDNSDEAIVLGGVRVQPQGKPKT